jgi:hypothetical protein
MNPYWIKSPDPSDKNNKIPCVLFNNDSEYANGLKQFQWFEKNLEHLRVPLSDEPFFQDLKPSSM